MFQLFVEGRGENEAGQKLVHKIIHHYRLGNHIFSAGRRLPNLHTIDGLKSAVSLARFSKETEGMLILRDDEDNCPKTLAPQIATYLKSLNAPFPIGYCIMYREFETLFVAYARHFAGRKIAHVHRGSIQFKEDIPIVDPESVRGTKEWISKQLIGTRAYKPTIDQLSLTNAIDIGTMENLKLPCFETLVRCVSNIIEHRGHPYVYPIS